MANTAAEVWQILGELTESQKETDRQLEELTEAQKASARRQEAIDRQLEELTEAQKAGAHRQQAIDRQLEELATVQKDSARRIEASSKKVDEQISRVDKQISDLGGAWGRFAEDLVAPACERLFLNRGIPVDQVSQRVKRRRDGQTIEIDILVVNQGHVLAVEVKSSLDVEDVREFIEDLQRFRTFFPQYADMQLYGAVAGIGINSDADRYAYRQGLFVLTQSGESISILNDEKFEPKVW